MASAAGAIKAGRAFVELFADDSRLVSGLRSAQNKLNAFGQDLLRMGVWLQAIGASIAAPFVLATKIFTETGDRLDAMSRRTGFAVDSLSQLELATQLTDFSMQGMENALKRMQRTIVQLVTGTNEASRALGFLHLNVREISKLSPEEQFALIADRLAAITDVTRRAGAAMAIFGREATGLLPMLLAGSEGLKEYKRRADALGLTLSGPVVKAADHLNDVLEIIKLQVNRFAFAVGGVLEPILTTIAERIVRIMGRVIAWAKANGELLRTVAKTAVVIAALGTAVAGLGVSFILASKMIGLIILPIIALKSILSGFITAFAVLVAVLSTQLGLLSFVLLTGVAVFLIWSGEGAKAIAWLGDRFRAFKEIVGGTLEGITNALLSGNLTAAANILWLGMKVAWLTGVGALKEIWNSAWTGLLTFGVNILHGVEAAFEIFTTTIREVWTNAWARVGDAWDEWAFFFKKGLIGLGAFVTNVADEIALAFIPKEHRDEVRKQLRQESNDSEVLQKGQLAKDFLERQKASTDQLSSDLAGITSAYEAAMAKIADSNIGTNAMLQEELKDGLQKTQDQLNAAVEEWQRARIDAQWVRGEVEGELLGIGDIVGKNFPKMPDLDELKGKIEVLGTFTQGKLLGRAGGDTAAERTAKATQASAEYLQELNEKTRAGGLSFGQ